MTHKERILAACRGEVPDCIPWVPRLDLWHNAHGRAAAKLWGITDDELKALQDALREV